VDAGLAAALASRDAGRVEEYLVANSGLPGPRLDLGLLGDLADAAVTDDFVETLLPGWLALSPADAPGDQPRVVLPCAAAVAYGELEANRPDRLEEVDDRLYRAATDPRWRVREAVTLGLQRMLRKDWDDTVAVLLGWADDEDLLVVRAAAAAVAEPPLLKRHKRARSALEIQHRAVERLHAVPAARRRTEPVRVLRQALGFTVGVAVAATGDSALLHSMAATGDPDLDWVVRENLKKARLRGWPDEVAKLTRV
jgi:hypothetical protein